MGKDVRRLLRAPRTAPTSSTTGSSTRSLAGPPDDPSTSSAGLVAAGLYAVIVLMSLAQDAGRTTYDTRAELTERPLSFLAEAFVLWHPDTNFGEMRNQAYGYLFPQGSWFALTELAGMPGWISQRLWSALVLILALEGARRVARVMGLAPGAALLAGLAFAFTPRLLGTVSVISAESLPGAVLPWATLPVLLALSGRLRPLPAAVLSGAAVVCMGGVNAVEVAACLPLPAILVLWGVRRGMVGWRFAAQWGASILVAALWWAVPLLVLAGYAPPFYAYVESAADTTSVVGWSEAVRGSSQWNAYLLAGDRAWWPGAFFLVTDRVMVLVAAVVSAVGLIGLVRLRSDLRVPLVLAALLGLSLLTVAHGGWEGSPLAAGFREALDGTLQIFRNVHKIDPVARLPLAVGFGWAAQEATSALLRSLRARWPAQADEVRRSTGLVLALPAALVLVLGAPYLANDVRTPGWTRIADHWGQTERYLAAHQDGRTTLVLPGSGFAMHDWGWTLDEPLLVLGEADFVSRSQVPLIPGESIRFLSALDQLVTSGRATEDLGDQLARAGIGHVVIRRDLSRSLTASPHPGGAAVSLQTAGLRSVASYGEERDGGEEVEIFEVDTRLSPVRATPVTSVRTVAGAPESVLDLQSAGLVEPGQATVLAGEPGWDAQPDVVTDSDQRRERAFGAVNEALAVVMTEDEPYRTGRAVHDYPTVPDPSQVVAVYDGLTGLSATSSQGYADTFGVVTPQAGPYAAVDGDRESRWVTSPASNPREQSLRMDFESPRSVREVTVLPVVEDRGMLPIRTLEVVAGDQRVEQEIGPSGTPVEFRLSGDEVSSLEVRITGVRSAQTRGSVGLREVQVDDLEPVRSFQVPAQVDPGASWSFGSQAEQRACRATTGVPDCDVRRIRRSEEYGGIDRTFRMSGTESLDVDGLAVARSTAATARLLEPLGSEQVVGATSVYGSDPKVASRFAYDGDESTVWLSADEDARPTLIFEWERQRTVTGISIASGSSFDGPAQAVVSTRDRSQTVEVGADVTVPLDRIRTRRLEITFVPREGVRHVRVPEVELLGADITRPFAPDDPTGAICGLGPNLEMDGELLPTRVIGTMADLVNGSPLRIEACDPEREVQRAPAGDADGGTDRGEAADLRLDAGDHRLRAPSTEEFQVVRVNARPHGTDEGALGSRSVQVQAWGDSERRLQVATGPEAVLHIPENFNRGWVATLDGRPLDSLRVDGWQQAWVVPAGAGGEVLLEYEPQALHAVLLPVSLAVSGLLLLAGLMVLVARPLRRPAVGADTDVPWARVWPPPVAAGWGRTLVVLVLMLALAGPVGATAFLVAAALTAMRPHLVPRVLVLAAVLVVGATALDVVADTRLAKDVADALAVSATGLVAGLVLGVTAAPGRRSNHVRR